MGRIIESILLPKSYMDLVLTQIQLADKVKRVEQERKRVQERMRRLREVYLEGDLPREQYTDRKRILDNQLASLVIPDVDAAKEAGRLLEELPTLWEEADLGERRKLLTAMLDAVYVDPVEERAIVALKPKPAFRVLFQIATTRENSGVILYKENPPEQCSSPEDDSPCSWWRRGRGGYSLFANNGGGPVVFGLLISPRVCALDGETGQRACLRSQTPKRNTYKKAIILRLQLYWSRNSCLFIAGRHFSSEQGLSETGSLPRLPV